MILYPGSLFARVFNRRNMSTLIKFVTKNGEEHLGWYDPHRTPMYYDIYGQDYEEIETSSEVQPFECLYWDSEKDAYHSLPWPLHVEEYKKDWKAIFDTQRLIEDSRPDEMSLRQMIREWLLLHAKCQSRVYIEKDFSIRSDGQILIDATERLPDYICFK